jgi:ceramide glucosyltransferase
VLAAATVVLLALIAGSTVFCILVVVAARKYRAVRPAAPAVFPPISVLKPLAGVDLGLEENLRSFFTQDYPDYEILCAVRNPDDPAIAVVRGLQAELPAVPCRLIITGEPPYANAKVYSLDRMLAVARNEIVVMSDSDIRVTPDMLRVIAAEFQDPQLGIATCPYRAVAGPSIWSRLEAAGMNTEFLAGVLVARMLEGMRFALGPTIAARKQALEQIGGFEVLKDYLAEDFVMGKFAAEKGWNVILSSYVIEHRIGSESFRANVTHRLRWFRSTRRSRPAGYTGQVFTNPLPFLIALPLIAPACWPVAAAGFIARVAAADATLSILNARWTPLIFVQDLLSFVFWIAGFFGNTIYWRGRTYYLHKDGKFTHVGDVSAS